MGTQSIAIIDDEAPIRVALARLVRLAGYSVVVFPTGEEFLASLADDIPACAILDIHLSSLSGFDVHTQLQKVCGTLPVVFITASDDAVLTDTVARAGGVCLLRKPFPSDALLAAIASALQSHAS